jgi:antibiotic biosynthesis monooxygenase (ABM) superfamily enzyme
MKRLILTVAVATAMFAANVFAAEATPHSVIHVITVKWKAGTSQAQIDKALQTVAAMPADYSGITHVWIKPIKQQVPDGYNHVIVMEFSSEDSLKKYVDSAAQKKFYDAYMPIREESRTSDITN